jgi:hypothetical protein
MLEKIRVESLNEQKLNVVRKVSKKKQILIYDTQRRIEDFVNKLKYRKNGEYDDIPHFIVCKNGNVIEIFNTKYSSKTFDEPNLDKSQIKIAIENLGWLTKNNINGTMTNWCGDIHRGDKTNYHTKMWRNYMYWDVYTEEQYNSLSLLCNELCEKHKIRKEIVSSQSYSTLASKFDGVVCKSNFSDIYIHINPSFKFNLVFQDDTL